MGARPGGVSFREPCGPHEARVGGSQTSRGGSRPPRGLWGVPPPRPLTSSCDAKERREQLRPPGESSVGGGAISEERGLPPVPAQLRGQVGSVSSSGGGSLPLHPGGPETPSLDVGISGSGPRAGASGAILGVDPSAACGSSLLLLGLMEATAGSRKGQTPVLDPDLHWLTYHRDPSSRGRDCSRKIATPPPPNTAAGGCHTLTPERG